MVCGIALFVVAILQFISSLFCWKVEIVGTNEVGKELKEKIQSEYAGKLWSEIEFSSLKNQILQNFENIGLVSVTRRGVTLIIDFSPLISNNDTIPTNLGSVVSNFNGIVSNILVVSGTPMVKVGDSVSIGQELIAPYWLNGEEKILCEARGEVSFYIWQSETVEFSENSVVQERSGNFVSSYKLLWGDEVLVEKKNSHSFKIFDEVEQIKYLSQILPIKLVTICDYELIELPFHRDFDAEKDALIMLARQKLLTNMSQSDILDEKSVINEVDGTYFVTYYVKTEIENG